MEKPQRIPRRAKLQSAEVRIRRAGDGEDSWWTVFGALDVGECKLSVAGSLISVSHAMCIASGTADLKRGMQNFTIKLNAESLKDVLNPDTGEAREFQLMRCEFVEIRARYHYVVTRAG